MRRSVFLVMLVLPLLIAAAPPPPGRIAVPVAPNAQSAGLRGPVADSAGMSSEQSPAPSASSLASNAPLPAPVAPAGDDQQCRMDCAQPYYFCIANDPGDSCQDAWSRCVSSCVAPGINTGISTAP